MKNKRKVVYILVIASILLVVIVGFKLTKKGEEKMESKHEQIEKFEEFVPKNDFDFDFKLAQSKGYSSSKETVTLDYIELQNKYDVALSMFLEEKISIDQLDTTLKSLDVISVPKVPFSEIDSTESYYQTISHLNSEYIYLRNNIRVERLDESDVELLKKADIENPTEKEKIIEMISRTFIDVLSVKFNDEKKESYNVVYHNNGKETVTNKTIVFWLSYQEEFDDSGNYVNREKEIEKRKAVEKLVSEYNLIFSEELNCDVKIFIHDN
jgi:RNase H-fold protein (predicted Holliday junction resolvase)